MLINLQLINDDEGDNDDWIAKRITHLVTRSTVEDVIAALRWKTTHNVTYMFTSGICIKLVVSK